MQATRNLARLALAATAIAGVALLAIGVGRVGAADAPGPAAKAGDSATAPASTGASANNAASANAAAPAAKPALAVTTTRPTTTALPGRLAANGSIAAWQEAAIGTEANGLRLAEVRVDVGDTVRRGQVLAVFATDTIRAELATAQAALAETEAALAEARANAERARQVADSGALSAVQVNQYLTAERTQAARLQSDQARLQLQQLRLKQAQVLAPDDGVISSRSATVGAVLPAGQELFRMVRRNRLEWRAEVTANDLERVRPGQRVEMTIASGSTLAGTVRMVGPTVDPQTRNALVYVDLPAGSAARPGMFARGEFDLGTSQALTVPQQAVVMRDGFAYVFAVGADGRVIQRKVQLGRRAGERIEILGGVAADTTLVASGAGFLADGDLVKVVAAPAATATR